MDAIFQKTIINCYAHLVENIHYENLNDFLLQYEVLPKATMEDINSLPNRRHKVRKLLDVLPRRSNTAFETFLRCLEISDQPHIAKILVDTLHKLHPQKQLSLNGNGFLPGSSLKQPLHPSSSEYELLQKQQPPWPVVCNSFLPEHDTKSTKTEIHTSMACTETVVDPHCQDPEPLPQQTMEEERDCYEMSSYPRGYMLIINNEKFTTPLIDRSGSSKDANDLQKLFWRLGFFCDIKDNLNVEDMKQLLWSFSKMDAHKDLSCCAVVLMSHGDEDPEEYVYGTLGGKVSVNELITYFNDQNCPNLKDKPKLFIIQACRNINNSTTKTRDPNLTNDDVSQRPPMMRLLSLNLSSDETSNSSFMTNSRADMLIAYSTAHGNKSFRHKMTGSIFIQSIIEVFNAKAHTASVIDMLIEVNGKLREDYHRQGQIGVPEVALTKKWYLKPST